MYQKLKFACTVAENSASSATPSRSSADLCMTESMCDVVLDDMLKDGCQQGNKIVYTGDNIFLQNAQPYRTGLFNASQHQQCIDIDFHITMFRFVRRTC